jgi:hypothetical protein
MGCVNNSNPYIYRPLDALLAKRCRKWYGLKELNVLGIEKFECC